MSGRLRRWVAPGVHANLTPMIDVTFLLIVFFVLVSQIVEVEHVDLRLPTLVEPATAAPEDEQRLVINIVPGPAGRAAEYRMGTRAFSADTAGRAALRSALAEVLAGNPVLRINLRADRETRYEGVYPAIEALTQAARDAASVRGQPVTPRLNLVVVTENRS